MENAKSALHQWIQSSKIKADYKYSSVGPDHNRSFMAEMGFYVRQLGRNVNAREAGSNKHSASKSCALSLVRQLFHLGVIPAFTGSLKKNRKDVDDLPPYDVALAPDLVAKILDTVQAMQAAPPVPTTSISSISEPTSLLPPVPEGHGEGLQRPPPKIQAPGVVSWSPPLPNWNPWTACNIDEGPLASASMDEISTDLAENHLERRKSDEALAASEEQRANLPIFCARDSILDAVQQHSVVLIRGNTGCGKTTQVCQYILDSFVSAGCGADCNIVCTQPRRISAVAVADRVACERCEDLGLSVGYSVR